MPKPLSSAAFAAYMSCAACGLPEGAPEPADDGRFSPSPTATATALTPFSPSVTRGVDGGAAAGAGPFVPYVPGAPVAGAIGPDGGDLSRLLFAVVGDTRPATVDDTSGYPAAIVATIFAGIAALRPSPPMVVSTGDYVFASASRASAISQAAPQFDIYLQARARFAGALFPAMGNHECTGSTTSNCGSGNANGTTSNYTAFMSKLLAPIQKTLPYYVININAVDNSWTSKFVFIAANAWDSTQSSWCH